jgi:succinoglycan biosynthesis protein ExoW
MSHGHVTVIIPFYQRRSGILARALRSVFSQTGVTGIDVVVVDDESPVSAADELADMRDPAATTVRILRRANGGPGAARNTALDALPPDTRYVAFLDSDDEWHPTHLARAVWALERGYDFYFADLYQLHQTVSAFQRAGRVSWSDHESIGDDCFAYRGDMVAQILTGNLIATPTVVYRYAPCARIRFEEDYSHAGEDYLFWLACASVTRRIVFSSRPEVVCGAGVNVYSGSAWGTDAMLRRVHCELKYRRAVTRLLPLAPHVATENCRHITRLRTVFILNLAHRLARRLPVDGRLIRQHAVLDPLSLVLFGPVLARFAVRALARRLAGPTAVR